MNNFKNINLVERKYIVFCFLYSILFFSQTSLGIFTFNGAYFGELAIFACVIVAVFLDDKYALAIFNGVFSVGLLFCLLIILMVAIIGWYANDDFSAAYTDARANIVFILGVAVGLRLSRRCEWLTYVYYIIFFTNLMSILNWIVTVLFAYGSNNDEGSVKYASMMMASILSLVVSADLKSRSKVFISFGIMLFLSSISFYRQYFVVSFFGLLFVLSFMVRNGLSLKCLVFGAVLFCFVYFFIPLDSVVEYFIGDKSRYIQLVGKSMDVVNLVSGSSTMTDSDGLRLAYYKIIIDQPLSIMLPHGLGYKAVFGNISEYFDNFKTPANTIDSVFFYLLYHYGLLFLIAIFFIGLYVVFFLGYSKPRIYFYPVFFMMFVLMVFDGSQLTVMQKSIWFGVCIGYVIFGGLTKRNGGLIKRNIS